MKNVLNLKFLLKEKFMEVVIFVGLEVYVYVKGWEEGFGKQIVEDIIFLVYFGLK